MMKNDRDDAAVVIVQESLISYVAHFSNSAG